MTAYLLVHYGYTEDYEVLAVYTNWSKAIAERDKIRDSKRKIGIPEYNVTDFDVLSFDVCEDENL